MTIHFDAYDKTVQHLINRVGKTIVIGVPLALGKPVGLLNALYRAAQADASLKLTIITGLTFARPSLNNELEKRFVQPFLDRILKDYEDVLYEHARETQTLPDNIRVIEFFLSPAKFLHNAYVQQNYISSAYVHAARDAVHFSMNVLAQQVAHHKEDGNLYSLSCNSDLFHDTARRLRAREQQGHQIAIVAEINANLPYMYGDAVVETEAFTAIVDTKRYRALFAVPREELSAQDHMIGLYTSTLIKDGGCLQIGIGKLSNAVANALILRHHHNQVYREILAELNVEKKFGTTVHALGGLDVFSEGLYASTEMFSDEYLQLYQQGILKKRAYDHLGLQRLLTSKKITEKINPRMLEVLLEEGVISSPLTPLDVAFLTKYGIFHPSIRFENDELILSSGMHIPADLSVATTMENIARHCLGHQLTSGYIVHAGFFFGSVDFYQQLNALPVAERQLINMTAIARTNALAWQPELLALQRQDMRLINSAIMLTVGGAVISDGLQDLQELSGVGGQFDFVNMAHNLENARGIINCRSTRRSKKGLESNILINYPNMTIPRFLRDVVVTEYGIADCRSKTDAEIIQLMLNITDKRFQAQLMQQAKKFGKLAANYQIPEIYRDNSAANFKAIMGELERKGYCLPYPFGSDFTEEENILQKGLIDLKNASTLTLIRKMFLALVSFQSKQRFLPYLERMQLAHPKNVREFIYQRLICYVLRDYV